MNKHKMFLVLTIISLTAVVGSVAGCGVIAPVTAKPTINSFTVSPANITAGQKATLNWDISGAGTATIQPDIGSVGAAGSLQLSPPDTITYVLTAANEAGNTSSSVTLTVNPLVVGKPDLVITDMYLQAETVYYKVKNQGDAAAAPTWASLSVFDVQETTALTESLAPGEEATFKFHNWRWKYTPILSGAEILKPQSPEAIDVKACLDIKNDIEESNKSNNCVIEVWGQPYVYDFIQQAHLATWRSSAEGIAGDVSFGGIPQKNGAAYMSTGYLYTCPEQVSNGWLLAKFADFYSDQGVSRSRPLELPTRGVFIAEVGFRTGAVSSDGVRIALGYIDRAFNLVLFPKMDVYSDGKMYTYRVDLSDLEDEKTELVLWIESKDSPDGDCVRFVSAMITQE